MLYRIFTEDKNRTEIEKIIGCSFDSFTIIPCVGYWQGEQEDSIIIEISCNNALKYKIQALCGWIRIWNGQESVLLQEVSVTSELI